jgi:hypothetical protein
MCHSSPEALHEAALDLLFDLLEQRSKEALNTAEVAELDAARSIVERLRQEWSALPGYVQFPQLED